MQASFGRSLGRVHDESGADRRARRVLSQSLDPRVATGVVEKRTHPSPGAPGRYPQSSFSLAGASGWLPPASPSFAIRHSLFAIRYSPFAPSLLPCGASGRLLLRQSAIHNPKSAIPYSPPPPRGNPRSSAGLLPQPPAPKMLKLAWGPWHATCTWPRDPWNHQNEHHDTRVTNR